MALLGCQIFPMLFTTAGNYRLGCPCTWLILAVFLAPGCPDAERSRRLMVGTGCLERVTFSPLKSEVMTEVMLSVKIGDLNDVKIGNLNDLNEF